MVREKSQGILLYSRSGKESGKKYFFKVRELSGNFEICQGILEFKQKSGNFEITSL